MLVGKSGCEYKLGNCDGPTGYSIHFPEVLSNYDGMTAYICRRFIPTTAFLVDIAVVLTTEQHPAVFQLFSTNVIRRRNGIVNKDQLSLTNTHDVLHHGERVANKQGDAECSKVSTELS